LCFFLDYRVEPLRLSELNDIKKKLSALESEPQIWAGDFNALTREDYDNEAWRHIAEVRERNRWEKPESELTEEVSKSWYLQVILMTQL
jgi:endonuclease/exonuclease/phosphatase family metal-dependent hydrolase